MTSSREMLKQLETAAAEARQARIAAATAPPQAWASMESAPKDGTLVDVLFDPSAADRSQAEFYAPGCTRKSSPTLPCIENVAFVNGAFRSVVDAQGAQDAAALAGDWGTVEGLGYGITDVRLTHWRPAAYPYR